MRVLAPALVLGVGSGVGLAACDTDDGRDMKPPDSYQEYVLQNTTPSTTTTTTTIAPPTTLAPSTSVDDTVPASDVSVTASDVSVADSTEGSTVDTAASSAPAESLPVDTFVEANGLTNLDDEGVEFLGSWPPGGEIPVEFTCNADENTPLLTWTAPPDGTAELALVVIDETADDFVHWLVFGLPPEAGSVGGPEPMLVGTEAENSAGEVGWAGPCPPDADVHTYRFTLYALDQTVAPPADSDPADIIEAIEAAATGATSFTGTYQVA